MKKQDLKDDYTVIYRNGENRIFNNGDFFYNGMRRNNIMNYSDDLLHVASDRFDIMSVIRDGVTIWTREETATLEEIIDMFIESKMKAQSEDRKAEYKQKKESGAYDYEAQEHDLTLKVKQMAVTVCKISKRAGENLLDYKKQREMTRQWIKLEDYKLKDEERLYVVCEAVNSLNGEVIKYQTMAEYVPSMTVKEEDFMDSQCWGEGDYNEKDEEYYAPEGFYEWQSETDTHWKISAKVTHVTPLLELP